MIKPSSIIVSMAHCRKQLMRKRLRVKIEFAESFFLSKFCRYRRPKNIQQHHWCRSAFSGWMCAVVSIGASNVRYRMDGSSDWGPDIVTELSTYSVLRKSYTVR